MPKQPPRSNLSDDQWDATRQRWDHQIDDWRQRGDLDFSGVGPREVANTLGVWVRVVVLVLALVGVFYIAACIYQRQIPIVGHLPVLIPPTVPAGSPPP